jgi:hypothetical protein
MRSQLHKEKLREIAQCLVRCGFLTIDSQAKALGVPRSTAWTIFSAQHKVSGLSPRLIKQILASSDLPKEVRSKIIEYVRDKASGKFGCNSIRLRRFRTRVAELGIPLPATCQDNSPRDHRSFGNGSVETFNPDDPPAGRKFVM